MSVNSKPFILSPVSSPSEYSPPTAITPLPIATLAPIPLELEPPVKEPSTAVPPTLIKSSEKDYIALDDYFSIDLDTSFESFSVNDRDPTYFSDSSIEIVKHSISDRTRAKTNDSIIKLETDNHTPVIETNNKRKRQKEKSSIIKKIKIEKDNNKKNSIEGMEKKIKWEDDIKDVKIKQENPATVAKFKKNNYYSQSNGIICLKGKGIAHHQNIVSLTSHLSNILDQNYPNHKITLRFSHVYRAGYFYEINTSKTLENFFTISIKHNGHSYRITRDVVIHDLENRKPNDALKVFYLHARSFGAVNNRMLIKTLSKFFKNKWVLYQGCFKDTTRFSGFYVLKFENPPKYMMKILFIDTDEASTKYNQQVLRVNESFFCAYHGSHSDNICQHTIKLYDSQDKVE